MSASTTILTESAVANILTTWAQATDADLAEGHAWYATAHAFAVSLAERHGLTVEAAAGIIAALSPRVSWSLNLRLAEQLCATGSARGLGVSIRRATRILLGESPATVLAAPAGSPRSGQKVRSFYANILNPEATDGPVTIDRHAWDIAAGFAGTDADRSGLDRVGVYSGLEDAYRVAARILGVAPTTVQATTWVAWRRIKNG